MSKPSTINPLEASLSSLRTFFLRRLKAFETGEAFELPDFDYESWAEPFWPYLPVKKISLEELVVLSLALAAHIRPHYFDRLIQDIYPKGGTFPHLGGLRGKGHRGFLPTGDTVLFILAGENLKHRFTIQKLFLQDHWFAKYQILKLELPERNEPAMSGQLVLDREFVEKITLGKAAKPVFSNEFPAALLNTKLTWEDLVIPKQTLSHIEDILVWLKHNETLLHGLGMDRKLKPGYRALFHGPPGTGKSMTAALLGTSTERDVYRVDLSTIVSKYIGETEKNLSNLFNRAENKDWILFFDEADALFGKRTQVQNAHDRYANQEVAYLLQRIESYAGLVILATNFKSNIDEAFIRRFQSIIHFPLPNTFERLKLWEKAFPGKIALGEDINMKQLAQKYALTGADIMNVVQYVSLQALAKEKAVITHGDIHIGIEREMLKSGRIR